MLAFKNLPMDPLSTPSSSINLDDDDDRDEEENRSDAHEKAPSLQANGCDDVVRSRSSTPNQKYHSVDYRNEFVDDVQAAQDEHFEAEYNAHSGGDLLGKRSRADSYIRERSESLASTEDQASSTSLTVTGACADPQPRGPDKRAGGINVRIPQVKKRKRPGVCWPARPTGEHIRRYAEMFHEHVGQLERNSRFDDYRYERSAERSLSLRVDGEEGEEGEEVRQDQMATEACPPCNPFWTPLEEDAFFGAIARHSRWRADLIAEEINNAAVQHGERLSLQQRCGIRALGKTPAQVQLYISRLQAAKNAWRDQLLSTTALSRHGETASSRELLEEMRSRAAEPQWGRFRLSGRGTEAASLALSLGSVEVHPAAREMSEGYIRWEESLAQALKDAEVLHAQRENEVQMNALRSIAPDPASADITASASVSAATRDRTDMLENSFVFLTEDKARTSAYDVREYSVCVPANVPIDIGGPDGNASNVGKCFRTPTLTCKLRGFVSRSELLFRRYCNAGKQPVSWTEYMRRRPGLRFATTDNYTQARALLVEFIQRGWILLLEEDGDEAGGARRAGDEADEHIEEDSTAQEGNGESKSGKDFVLRLYRGHGQLDYAPKYAGHLKGALRRRVPFLVLQPMKAWQLDALQNGGSAPSEGGESAQMPLLSPFFVALRQRLDGLATAQWRAAAAAREHDPLRPTLFDLSDTLRVRLDPAQEEDLGQQGSGGEATQDGARRSEEVDSAATASRAAGVQKSARQEEQQRIRTAEAARVKEFLDMLHLENVEMLLQRSYINEEDGHNDGEPSIGISIAVTSTLLLYESLTTFLRGIVQECSLVQDGGGVVTQEAMMQVLSRVCPGLAFASVPEQGENNRTQKAKALLAMDNMGLDPPALFRARAQLSCYTPNPSAALDPPLVARTVAVTPSNAYQSNEGGVDPRRLANKDLGQLMVLPRRIRETITRSDPEPDQRHVAVNEGDIGACSTGEDIDENPGQNGPDARTDPDDGDEWEQGEKVEEDEEYEKEEERMDVDDASDSHEYLSSDGEDTDVTSTYSDDVAVYYGGDIGPLLLQPGSDHAVTALDRFMQAEDGSGRERTARLPSTMAVRFDKMWGGNQGTLGTHASTTAASVSSALVGIPDAVDWMAVGDTESDDRDPDADTPFDPAHGDVSARSAHVRAEKRDSREDRAFERELLLQFPSSSSAT